MQNTASLDQLVFDNQFTSCLPDDGEAENFRRQIKNAIYSRVQPVQVPSPKLVSASPEVARLIGLDQDALTTEQFVQVFSGNTPLTNMDPHATCYGGHQFGNWAGQLGDGRAINLGELVTGDQHFMLQLKGAGPTPYSRTADGLAVLRSSVREYLCSEAMHHLGIPTTRALSLITTGDAVVRDMLYDGHPEEEPGAVVCRVSSSFARFGHWQLLTARQELELLKTFTDFIIRREFPHIQVDANNPADAYVQWFREVSTRTATLIVHWMRVGFVHGVMNTDNMSILGETIDYGPYGWLDDFDPEWTPNTTDAGNRRYRYGQQPGIAQWNLLQLANAILPLVNDPKPLEEALSDFAKDYEQKWQAMMAAKLGLDQVPGDLLNGLHNLLTSTETDMTLFYRTLATLDLEAEAPEEALRDALYEAGSLTKPFRDLARTWLSDYRRALKDQGVTDRAARMNQTNPKYVLRNYLAQVAIDAAHEGDFSKVNELLDVMRKPYDEQPHYEAYAGKRPEWARTKVGCSMLSCSS